MIYKCIPYQTNRPENCPDTLQMSPLEYFMVLGVEALPLSKFKTFMTLSPKAIKFSHVEGRNWKKELYGFLLKSHDKSSDINVGDNLL